MDDDQSRSTHPPDAEFWSRLARELQSCEALRADPALKDLPLSSKQEQLLWEFAEGRLSTAEEEEHCLDLVASNTVAARRLMEIHTALEAGESMRPGDRESIWKRATRPVVFAAPPVVQRVRHLIVELAETGLRLVYSAGRPAYSPALARTSDEASPTSIAQEYLTSIGTIQLVVDQAASTNCDVSIIAGKLLDPKRAESLLIKLENVESGQIEAANLQDGRARLAELCPGSYRLVIHDGQQVLNQLLFELKVIVSEDQQT